MKLPAVFRHSTPGALVLSLVALPALMGCNLQLSTGVEGHSEWKKTYAVGAAATLEIKNTNGVIDVTPSDGPDISVTADRVAKASTEDAAKRAAEELTIAETISGASVSLDGRVHTTGMFSGERKVLFHVRAPKGTILKLSTTNGTVQVTDMAGAMTLDTTNGEIKGMNLVGATRAETVNGAVALDFADMPAGGVRATTTNGGVVVTLPKSAKARITASVTNGGVAIEDLPVSYTEQSRREVDATLNGGGAELRLETVNGGVKVRGKN